MIHLRTHKSTDLQKRGNGFTAPELLVSILTGTLIIGAASTGLRATQTLISESHGKATLRQNTTNGLRMMRSEIERSMNILVSRTEGVLTGQEDTDLNQGFEIIEEFVGVSIPVVENTQTQRLTGIIHEANIIQAYNEAVKTARGEEQGLDNFSQKTPQRD